MVYFAVKNPPEDSTTLNRYTFYVSASSFTKQTVLDIWAQINLNRIIVDDFNIPFLLTDRLSQQNLSREAFDLML